VVNKTVDGVEAKLGWHFCFGAAWGNAAPGIFPSDAGYGSVLPYLAETTINQYVLDFAVREMSDAHILKNLPAGKGVAVGVIDVRTLQIETPQQVAEWIRKVLKFISPERVTLTTDCGLRALPRFCAYNKLRSLVAGAQIMRQELTGQKA
jgi:5-methyltetrahydropteroyltriglutamate--homocysteine methyltransferase